MVAINEDDMYSENGDSITTYSSQNSFENRRLITSKK